MTVRGREQALAAPSPEDTVRPLGAPRRSLLSRLSTGHVVMIVAGLLAVVANLAVLSSRDDVFSVASAAGEIRQGQAITADAFEAVDVNVDEDTLRDLVLSADLGALEGKIAARTIPAGALVHPDDFRSASAPLELRAMSIPVDREDAVGGDVSAGDLVDVIAVQDGIAEYITTAAEVLAVPESATTGIAGGGSYYVTVAVDAETALRLALALDEGDVSVVRSTGATPPENLEFTNVPEEPLPES